MEFKGTKGKFKDGTIGWKYYSYKEDERVGFSTHEIHWSDDGECVAEVVHDKENAKLIAAAPELLAFAIEMVKRYPNSPWITNQATEAINKALN